VQESARGRPPSRAEAPRPALAGKAASAGHSPAPVRPLPIFEDVSVMVRLLGAALHAVFLLMNGRCQLSRGSSRT